MKRSDRKATAVITPPRHEEAGEKAHKHCDILEICPGASLRELSDEGFERLASSVRSTLESLRTKPQPHGVGATARSTTAVRAASSVECWESGRYFATIDGEPHLCIVYRCDDGSSYDACQPI